VSPVRSGRGAILLRRSPVRLRYGSQEWCGRSCEALPGLSFEERSRPGAPVKDRKIWSTCTHTLYFQMANSYRANSWGALRFKGYKAIALTITSIPRTSIFPARIVKVCKVLNRFWKIRAIPGVEITHCACAGDKRSREIREKNGAKIIVVHGETICEPVITGTNRAAIEAGCDILAHPGLITKSDIGLAKSAAST